MKIKHIVMAITGAVVLAGAAAVWRASRSMAEQEEE